MVIPKFQKHVLEHDTHIARLDQLWALGLVLLTILSRMLFQSHILYHWDSVNFAFSIQEFNIAKDQPQPPGYILYVGLISVVNRMFQDPQTTMVTISIIASTMSIVFLFYLGRSMFNRRVGIISALLLATSPLFWFYGEIALPHTLDAFLVILGIWFLYMTLSGESAYWLPSVIILAIAGGVRQQTLVFLLPATIFALRKIGLKNFIIAGFIGGLLCLIWLIPLLQLSGGLAAYIRITNEFSARFQTTTSVFANGGIWGLARNLIKLSMYTAYGLGAGGIIVLLFGYYFRKNLTLKIWEKIRTEKAIFMGLWIAPVLLFYTFIHMGQQGLVFVYLPALIIFLGYCLDKLLTNNPNISQYALAGILLMNLSIFLIAPEYPFGSSEIRLLTRQTISNSDHYFLERIQLIKEKFPPQSTVILAGSWHHLQYYLPNYHVIPFDIGSKWEVDQNRPINSPADRIDLSAAGFGVQAGNDGFAHVIVFDDDIIPFNQTPQKLAQIKMANGELNYFPMRSQDRFVVDATSYKLVSK